MRLNGERRREDASGLDDLIPSRGDGQIRRLDKTRGEGRVTIV